MDSEVIEELTIEISSHPELLEPKGMHLQVEGEKVEMDDIKSNYMKESEIQEELKNVGIDNHLEIYYDGSYKFRRCEYCDGPLLGHLKEKCPKEDSSEDYVKEFEEYIKNIGEFKEAIQTFRVKNLTERIGKETW